MINILAVSLRCGISLPAHKYHSLCSEAETAARERTNGPAPPAQAPKTWPAHSSSPPRRWPAPPRSPPEDAPSRGFCRAVPAAIAAAVPAIAAQPASAAILGIKGPAPGQAGVVFAPVLLVAVPIVLIVIGNGAIPAGASSPARAASHCRTANCAV